jgi:hypothetical protein
MNAQQYLRYFLRLTLNGMSEETLPRYELVQADYEWLTKYVSLTATEVADLGRQPAPAFLWFETVDGLNVMVSEQDIEMLRLFTQSSPTPPPEPPQPPPDLDLEELSEDEAADYDDTVNRGQVEFYFRDRLEPIVTNTLDDPERIAYYFPTMDDPAALAFYQEEDSQFIFFMDDGGEEVGVRLDEVVLLVAYPGSLDFGFMEVDY